MQLPRDIVCIIVSYKLWLEEPYGFRLGNINNISILIHMLSPGVDINECINKIVHSYLQKYRLYCINANNVCNINGYEFDSGMNETTPELFNKIIYISGKINKLIESGVPKNIISDLSRFLTPGNELTFNEYFGKIKLFGEIVMADTFPGSTHK